MADLNLDLSKLKNIKFTKEQQQYLALGILLLAGGAYGYWNFGLKPLSSQIEKLTKDIKDKKDNIEKARKLKGQWEEYNQRLSRVQAGLAFVGTRLPSSETYQIGWSRLIRMGTEGNVKLEAGGVVDDSAKTKSEFEGFEKKVQVVVFSGDFVSLGNFLSRLTGERQVYLIEDISAVGLPRPYQEDFHQSALIGFRLITYVEKAASGGKT